MSFLTVSYNPEWHNRLLSFMQGIYPHRDIRYLDWWLSNIDNCSKCWDKCVIVLDEDIVIGCTTVNELVVFDRGEERHLYAQANTILLETYRGKGISRQIYERYNYPEWITIGFTDVAWKIQPKYVRNFTPINPVNVYISLSLKGLLKSLCYRQMRHDDNSQSLPTYLYLSKREEFIEEEDLSQLNIPKDGRWTSDSFEIVRDKSFLKKRYVDIYCYGRYHIYQYRTDGKTDGYIVLRRTVYKGFDMISLVDFRFKKREDENKALKAAVKAAGMCGIGLVITLTSRRWRHRLFPFTIKTKKKLHSAVGMNNYTDEFNDMLITSADSDLDFVYYK